MNAAGRLPLLALCLALSGRTALANGPEDAADVLFRAARFYEAPGSKESGLWRLAWLGTSDLGAVDQARRPGLRLPTRAQDLLVIDPVGRRAALDTQRIGSDGTPGLWRHQTGPDGGRSVNRKTNLTFDAADRGRHLWERLAWRLPQLAIAEVEALRGPRVFDRGPARLEVRQLEGLHAEEMLVAWFPEQRAALTADVTDYLVEEKRFLQLVDREGLAVETIHAVHSARPTTRAELDADLDFGN